MLLLNELEEIYDEIKKHDEDELKEDLEGVVILAKVLRIVCKERNLLNEQYYLGWEDNLNVLSTMDPDTELTINDIIKG